MKNILQFLLVTLMLSCSATFGQAVKQSELDTQKPTIALRAAQTESAVCQETENSIVLTVGKQPFLTYHKSVVKPPAGIDAVYERSGYIHPIQTPSGREVTGDFAPNHAHQHAFFMAWVSTEFAGHEVDFWNQKKKSGRISHTRVVAVNNTDSFAEFEVELSHQDIAKSDQPVGVLSERWKVRAYHRSVGEPFVFDFESHQIGVADSPLTLKKYHYGGFGLRGNQRWYKPEAKAAIRAWSKQLERSRNDSNARPPTPLGFDTVGHKFLTSSGNQRHDGNHTRARWTTIYGPVDKEVAGLAVLSHSSNFRSPQHVRLHPAEPYFSYVPVVDDEFEIKPQETYSTRFRIVSYDGEPKPEMLNKLWDDYVTVVKPGPLHEKK